MLGLTERVLREGPLNDAQRRDLDGVTDLNASLLLKQVNDLLDISKLESAKVTLFRSDIDLARLVRVTSASFDVVAAQRCCTLTVDTPDQLMAQVDAEKVQRILCNLLSNAFKIDSRGGAGALLFSRSRARPHRSRSPTVVGESRSSFVKRCSNAFSRSMPGLVVARGGRGSASRSSKSSPTCTVGDVAVEDAPEGGARFVVELPLSVPSQEPEVVMAGSPRHQSRCPRVCPSVCPKTA